MQFPKHTSESRKKQVRPAQKPKPGRNSQEHGGKSRSRFASGTERLVDLVRRDGGRTPAGTAEIESSEASDAVNKALVFSEDADSAGRERYLSGKLGVGVDDDPALRYLLANVDGNLDTKAPGRPTTGQQQQ